MVLTKMDAGLGVYRTIHGGAMTKSGEPQHVADGHEGRGLPHEVPGAHGRPTAALHRHDRRGDLAACGLRLGQQPLPDVQARIQHRSGLPPSPTLTGRRRGTLQAVTKYKWEFCCTFAWHTYIGPEVFKKAGTNIPLIT